MIKKLEKPKSIRWVDAISKINELIDIVNTQQIDLNNHTCRLMALENKDNQVTDEFEEQRKWIGKLCRFWDDGYEPENCVYGVLCNIFDLHHYDCPFQCGNGEWYEYCEPVSEDLIYKSVKINKNVK